MSCFYLAGQIVCQFFRRISKKIDADFVFARLHMRVVGFAAARGTRNELRILERAPTPLPIAAGA